MTGRGALSVTDSAASADSADRPILLTVTRAAPDKAFRALAFSSGISVLAIMLLVGTFLTLRGADALTQAGWSFFTQQAWEPDAGRFGIAAIIFGTVLIALVAITVAVPLAAACALYITQYAPLKARPTLISLVDLMAAIPSIVFGLWGFFWLQAEIVPISRWISHNLSFIPIFAVNGADPDDALAPTTIFTSSTFIAGIVVAMMITPIITSIMREVFDQAPVGEREGALALGATRWSMIRTVIVPFGRAGMIGGSMLGLGRALGETIAVYIIISPVFVIQPRVLENGAISVSSLIALRYGEATEFGMSALMAAGLSLFLMTLAVNFAASFIVSRSRSGASS